MNCNELREFVEALRGVEQGVVRHPEGNAYSHSLQVYNIAVRETVSPVLRVAAMLHDVGKVQGVLNHDSVGGKMLGRRVVYDVRWLVENHMRVYWFLEGKMTRLGKVQDMVYHRLFSQLVWLRRFDVMGRNPLFDWVSQEKNLWR